MAVADPVKFLYGFRSIFCSVATKMIMAKVLVGEFIKGDQRMVIPPKIPGSERHYDTTSNSDHSPALIVSRVSDNFSFGSIEENTRVSTYTLAACTICSHLHVHFRLVASPPQRLVGCAPSSLTRYNSCFFRGSVSDAHAWGQALLPCTIAAYLLLVLFALNTGSMRVFFSP